MKTNIAAVAPLILLTVASIFTLFLPIVNAAEVEITSVSPSSQQGKVGEEVRVIGTINTTDGRYQIWFGSELIADKTASGNSVDLNFTVPELPGGNYTITLIDVDRNLNTTTWFYLETAYYVEAVVPALPELLQESDSVVLNVTVTGGEPDTVYYADLTVKLPEPLNTNYSALMALPNTANTGKAYASITFPHATLFQPSGSNTNYTGLYAVYFNKTQNLAETEFFIGFTEKSEYHREELVEVRAIGYQPTETATITITYAKNGTTLYSEVVNASEQGIMSTTWLVPWNASIGNYNITITSESTAKPVRDSQLFSVLGYPIEVYTRNLAGDFMPQTLVEANEVMLVEPSGVYADLLVEAGYNPVRLTLMQFADGSAASQVSEWGAGACVVMLDVIEHEEKIVVLKALEKIQAWAGSIVLMTPLGFMPQDYDVWGLGEHSWQTHRSGWMPADFPGWKIYQNRWFHGDQGGGAFCAIWRKG